MTQDGIDSRGRRNPSAWRAWLRGQNAAAEPARFALATALVDNRERKGGAGARARRAIRRAGLQAGGAS